MGTPAPMPLTLQDRIGLPRQALQHRPLLGWQRRQLIERIRARIRCGRMARLGQLHREREIRRPTPPPLGSTRLRRKTNNVGRLADS